MSRFRKMRWCHFRLSPFLPVSTVSTTITYTSVTPTVSSPSTTSGGEDDASAASSDDGTEWDSYDAWNNSEESDAPPPDWQTNN